MNEIYNKNVYINAINAKKLQLHSVRTHFKDKNNSRTTIILFTDVSNNIN